MGFEFHLPLGPAVEFKLKKSINLFAAVSMSEVLVLGPGGFTSLFFTDWFNPFNQGCELSEAELSHKFKMMSMKVKHQCKEIAPVSIQPGRHPRR